MHSSTRVDYPDQLALAVDREDLLQRSDLQTKAAFAGELAKTLALAKDELAASIELDDSEPEE